MDLFGAAHGWMEGGEGAKKSPSLKSVTHIHYQTSHSYTLPKEYSKNIWTTWHTSWVALTSAFFIGNQQSLQYQKIQIQITFRYIISNSFNFYWVFKDFLIDMVTNFIMSAKLASPGALTIKIFQNKVMTVWLLTMTLPTKVYHVNQIAL